MEFISVEDFNKQDKEVKAELMNWWKCNLGDLYIDNEEYKSDPVYYNVRCLNIELESNIEGDWEYLKTVTTPLFSEGQLRQFIEDKTGCIINVSYNHKPKDGYMELEFDFYKYPTNSEYMIYVLTKDIIASNLLQAYWQVVVQIIKEEIK